MPINVTVSQNPISVSVNPQTNPISVSSVAINNGINVSNLPQTSVDLSNYATIPYVGNVSGELNNSIQNLNISGGAAGVISLNNKTGILLLNGVGGISITQNNQNIFISGSGYASSIDLYGFITSGQSDLRYYPINNPNGFLNSLSGLSTGYILEVSGSLYSYINFISGELFSQINGNNNSSGVLYLNTLAGSINLISSNDYLSFNNTGNNINIDLKPQNLQIYRNSSGQITGVQKNIDFIKIYRNINDNITGVYYKNYYKKVLLDIDNNITGVNVIYI